MASWEENTFVFETGELVGKAPDMLTVPGECAETVDKAFIARQADLFRDDVPAVMLAAFDAIVGKGSSKGAKEVDRIMLAATEKERELAYPYLEWSGHKLPSKKTRSWGKYMVYAEVVIDCPACGRPHRFMAAKQGGIFPALALVDGKRTSRADRTTRCDCGHIIKRDRHEPRGKRATCCAKCRGLEEENKKMLLAFSDRIGDLADSGPVDRLYTTYLAGPGKREYSDYRKAYMDGKAFGSAGTRRFVSDYRRLLDMSGDQDKSLAFAIELVNRDQDTLLSMREDRSIVPDRSGPALLPRADFGKAVAGLLARSFKVGVTDAVCDDIRLSDYGKPSPGAKRLSADCGVELVVDNEGSMKGFCSHWGSDCRITHHAGDKLVLNPVMLDLLLGL